LLLVLVLACSPHGGQADSVPIVVGNISGTEWCIQSVCGRAIFAGAFSGRVGRISTAKGTFWVSVGHEELPPPGQSAKITEGEWSILAGGRILTGDVAGGSLSSNGDETFDVDATLDIILGGTGELEFIGLLDHRPLERFPPGPPTITGRIEQ
jgi:hypothetical protein